MDGTLGILARARAALARLARIPRSPAADAGAPCPYRPSHLADLAARVSFPDTQLAVTPTYPNHLVANGYTASAQPSPTESRASMPVRVTDTVAGRPFQNPTLTVAQAPVVNSEPITVALLNTISKRSAPTADAAAAEVHTVTNTQPVAAAQQQVSSFPTRKPECR